MFWATAEALEMVRSGQIGINLGGALCKGTVVRE